MNDLCVDVGYKSINHVGEQLCGDHVDLVEQGENSSVIVLADGLGSGVKASILSTSTASLYLDAVRNILVVLVYMGVAFLVGKNYLEKKRLAAWLTPIIVYVFIRFTDVILNTYAPALVAKIVYMVVLAFVAAVSVWMIRNWYQSEKQAKKQF